jgi:hypothetical protein
LYKWDGSSWIFGSFEARMLLRLFFFIMLLRIVCMLISSIVRLILLSSIDFLFTNKRVFWISLFCLEVYFYIFSKNFGKIFE